MHPLLEPSEGIGTADTWILVQGDLYQASDLQNYEMINLCFQPSKFVANFFQLPGKINTAEWMGRMAWAYRHLFNVTNITSGKPTEPLLDRRESPSRYKRFGLTGHSLLNGSQGRFQRHQSSSGDLLAECSDISRHMRGRVTPGGTIRWAPTSSLCFIFI